MARLVERGTRARKVAGSFPDRNGGRFFFSRFNFLCGLLFGVRSTLVFPRWYVKDPGHLAKSASGGLHLNTHTPLTQRSRSGLTMPLFTHSVGTYQETSSHATRQGTQSSQLTEPLWTDPGIKSGISVHELTSTSKKKKKKAHAGE